MLVCRHAHTETWTHRKRKIPFDTKPFGILLASTEDSPRGEFRFRHRCVAQDRRSRTILPSCRNRSPAFVLPDFSEMTNWYSSSDQSDLSKGAAGFPGISLDITNHKTDNRNGKSSTVPAADEFRSSGAGPIAVGSFW